MYQPAAKLEFVRRYCPPQKGWIVFVDIDPSEEGKTGGKRKTAEARKRQREIVADAERVRNDFAELDVTVGGSRTEWFTGHDLPMIEGDRDIIAFHKATHRCLIAEVEGESSGQPEQKVYKAVGQIVVAGSVRLIAPWTIIRVIVVTERKMRGFLSKCTELERLDVTGLSLSAKAGDDEWLFGGRSIGSLESVEDHIK